MGQEPDVVAGTGTARARRAGVRLALIAAGYAAAWYAGELAVWWKDRGVREADQLAQSGMFAFGDAVLFLGVFSAVAVVPTLLLFRSLGASPRFWRAYAAASVALSSTALLAGVSMLVPARSGWPALEAVRSAAVLRVLAAPFFFMLVAPGLLPAAGPSRRRSAVACGFEVFAMASFVVWLAMALARR